jgi:hypothetical protein
MKHIQYILMMTVIVLFVACSQDIAEETVVQEPEASLRLSHVSRAMVNEPESGDIRIFLTHGTTATEGLFKYTGSSWTTQLKLKSGERTYQLYGYMPDNADFVRSVTDFNENGAVLHIQQMPPMAAQDYCIVTGVHQAADENDETAAARGVFSFDYNSQRENYVNLLVDHLYSCIIFCMKVGEDYNAVRAIRIKRMKLRVADISSYNVNVTLTKGVGISSVVHNMAGTGASELPMRDSEVTLTTTPTTVCSGYIIPANALLENLRLVIEYDIYDKQGNKIAERTATNKLAYSLEELQRGEERTLMINIDPSYLYDLSQEDPPFVVIRQ